MKILNKIWGVSLLALLLIVAAPHKSRAQDEYISEQDFYDELAPYGTWVNDPQYGDVWIPDVGGDFRPYRTQGHWVLTSYGNTWVSDYPWGWATFHYGRWRYDDFYGWEWIPGYEWAPAWVSWRHGGGYYGWAPLMPGISISLSFGSNYRVPDSYWAFAPEAYINRSNIYNYYVPHTRVVNIIRNTTIINNTYLNGGRRYIAGPRAADIQRYTHQRPRVYSINNAARPGTMSVQNNTVNVFRPAVRRAPDARPARVVDANAYKQQNPNQGIARRGTGGAAGFNHDNAAKLASFARNANDNNNAVHVNNRPNNEQQSRRPDQQGNRRPDGQSQQSIAQPQPAQTPATPNQPAQQPAFNPAGGRGDNKPGNKQQNDLRQKQQQINGEQKALREQKRDEYRRQVQQSQSTPQNATEPLPINGQTPIQQQQDAIRSQRRQLDRQQAQQEQAKRQQQQQVQQQDQAQRAQQQQAQQAQQRGAQQAAQQQAQQQQAQREQQKQAQQKSQQQQQAQQTQREQQRQAQQAQQAQRQQQQQAQQTQREQQRGQQQQQQQQQRRPTERKPNQ